MVRRGSGWGRALCAVVGFALGIIACAAPGPAGSPVRAHRFQVTGGTTAGPLRVDRVELVFDNGLGETTVPKDGETGARAVIRFSGNGPFRAQWKVDGRVVETVSLLVTFGSTLTLPTAEGTVLPTFEPGPHELTLEILQPSPGFRVPVIRYFVTMGKPRT